MIISALISCDKQRESVTTNSGNLDPVIYKNINRVKMFFGHQSVGYNILTGVRRIAPSLPVTELSGPIKMDSIPSGIIHLKIGRNGTPGSKISDFKKELINNNFGAGVSVAAMKFCYVDFNEETDVKSLFTEYSSAIDSIKHRFPDLSIMHITVPLTTYAPRNLKQRIKFLFKPDLANIKRNEYNNMLRNTFQGKDAIFDLAASESKGPDGKKSTFTYKGKQYEALYAGYSFDGGHLNETGQIVAAQEFLAVLDKINIKVPEKALMTLTGFSYDNDAGNSRRIRFKFNSIVTARTFYQPLHLLILSGAKLK
jgi:hypothetical protein